MEQKPLGQDLSLSNIYVHDDVLFSQHNEQGARDKETERDRETRDDSV